MANLCYARARKNSNGKFNLVKGEETEFPCYAAKHEARFELTYNARKYNTILISKIKNNPVRLAGLILKSLETKKSLKAIRIHSAGDFVSFEYFVAWLIVSIIRDDLTIFGYTKILPYVDIANELKIDNFHLVYSFGGKMDYLRDDNVQTAFVITNEDDSKGLPIACHHALDTGDYDLITETKQSFNLMIH